MKELLKILLKNNIYPQSSIFIGKKNWNLFDTVNYVIKFLFCKNISEKPCNSCINCLKVNKNVHPDLKIIEPENNSKSIKINQIREVQNFCKMTSFGNKKIVLIKDAFLMTVEASNSLLKILEEPGENNYFILTTDNKYRLLPTILSRCVHFHLKPVKKDFIYQNLDFDFDKSFIEEFKFERLKNLTFSELYEKIQFAFRELEEINKLIKLLIVINSANLSYNLKVVSNLLNLLEDIKFNLNKETIIGKVSFLIYRELKRGEIV